MLPGIAPIDEMDNLHVILRINYIKKYIRIVNDRRVKEIKRVYGRRIYLQSNLIFKTILNLFSDSLRPLKRPAHYLKINLRRSYKNVRSDYRPILFLLSFSVRRMIFGF